LLVELCLRRVRQRTAHQRDDGQHRGNLTPEFRHFSFSLVDTELEGCEGGEVRALLAHWVRDMALRVRLGPVGLQGTLDVMGFIGCCSSATQATVPRGGITVVSPSLALVPAGAPIPSRSAVPTTRGFAFSAFTAALTLQNTADALLQPAAA
jgi:hypothetical protein